MLSKEQKLALAQMVFNNKDVIMGEYGPNLTKVEKQQKWMEILIKLNSMGADITDYQVSMKNYMNVWHISFQCFSVDFKGC